MTKPVKEERDDRGRFQEKPGSLHRKPISFKVSKEVREWIDGNPDLDIRDYLRECLHNYMEEQKTPKEKTPKMTPA
ncbi:MAG: hypothetical protein KME22_06585 [Hassallia sp. WJT32-NPBG1]|jgi:hypothetical protein|nr:hypothetical protein [Hassallia sp. WJT32-NPBG1]